MTREPRIPWLEMILEAAGGHTDLREDLVGDLAEEYERRIILDGKTSARRWYYREAARAVPHLLYGQARHLRRDQARTAVVAVGISSVLTTLLCVVVGLAVSTLLQPIIGSLPLVDIAATSPEIAAAAIGCLLFTAGPLFGGYVAARFDECAPLASAAAFGVVWSAAFIAFIAFIATRGSSDPASWLHALQGGSIIATSAIGALARVYASAAGAGRMFS
jgi:hypothetical protein